MSTDNGDTENSDTESNDMHLLNFTSQYPENRVCITYTLKIVPQLTVWCLNKCDLELLTIRLGSLVVT